MKAFKIKLTFVGYWEYSDDWRDWRDPEKHIIDSSRTFYAEATVLAASEERARELVAAHDFTNDRDYSFKAAGAVKIVSCNLADEGADYPGEEEEVIIEEISDRW